MIRYEVAVVADMPYPIEKSYTILASSFPTAISRAVREWKKEDRIKRRKVNSVRVKANRLASQ